MTQFHNTKINSDNPVLLHGFLFIYLAQLKTVCKRPEMDSSSEIFKELSSTRIIIAILHDEQTVILVYWAILFHPSMQAENRADALEQGSASLVPWPDIGVQCQHSYTGLFERLVTTFRP